MSVCERIEASRVVCRCIGVTEDTLVECIQSQPLRTVREVTEHTRAGDGCMCCHVLIQRYLAEHREP